eukprot:scaffold196194_cov15-Prasinocladus_malaysianus.AAC.1
MKWAEMHRKTSSAISSPPLAAVRDGYVANSGHRFPDRLRERYIHFYLSAGTRTRRKNVKQVHTSTGTVLKACCMRETKKRICVLVFVQTTVARAADWKTGQLGVGCPINGIWQRGRCSANFGHARTVIHDA